MVEKRAFGEVKGFDTLHFVGCKLEVVDVEVLFHTVAVDGLRNDDDIALGEVAEGNLCHALAMHLADFL